MRTPPWHVALSTRCCSAPITRIIEKPKKLRVSVWGRRSCIHGRAIHCHTAVTVAEHAGARQLNKQVIEASKLAWGLQLRMPKTRTPTELAAVRVRQYVKPNPKPLFTDPHLGHINPNGRALTIRTPTKRTRSPWRNYSAGLEGAAP